MTLSLEEETASKEHIYLHPTREKGKFEQKMKIYGLEIVLALALSFLILYAYRVMQDRRRAVPQIYEVFLSFRGPDDRNGFTDFLCKTLENAGFQVFLDDKAIPHGKKIGRELLRAIRTCTIAIPIISEQYARSEWCLQELTEIIDCHRKHGISVFPVFYKVDVVDVGRQRGSFEVALSELEKKFSSEQVRKWRKALTSVAKIRGWKSQAIADGREADLVEMVRERVSSELKRRRIERLPKILRSVYLYFSEKSKCQVFLAFRDPGVQTGLATYIRAELVAKRIRVFSHDDSSLIGTDVADSIWNAIRQCEIYIPIFSRNFASRWFLEGLAHMVERKTERQSILPIFYKVSPSQVRNVLCDCQNDMLIYENPEGKITYLEDVLEYRGWVLKEEIGDEAALVRDVVKKVLALLNNPPTDDEPSHID